MGIHDKNQRGETKMTIEKALSLSTEEFNLLCEECYGFNNEKYKNHQKRSDGESTADFLLKGSRRIKNHPVIKGNMI